MKLPTLGFLKVANLQINLGCGSKHKKDYVNIDFRPPADIVADVTKGLPFADNEATLVEADNLLEHFDNDEFLFVMNEVWRILKPGGIFWFKVPDALHWMDGAFGDPTHKRFFVPRSFKYLTESNVYDTYGSAYGFKPWKQIKLETDARFFTCELSPKK